MKVLAKCVNIMGEEFVLISDNTIDGKQFFGTIPYTELDEKGRMKRGLNGFEMSVDFESIEKAVKRRETDIKIEKLTQKYMKKGIDRLQAGVLAIKKVYGIS